METSETNKAIFGALVKTQAALKAVKKDSENPFLHHKYADLAAIIEEARPHLATNGLAVLQFVGEFVPNVVVETSINEKTGEVTERRVGLIPIRTMIIHESGEWMAETMSLPCRDNSAQGAGSAITYSRRYGLQSLLGMAAEDDDASASQGNGHTGAARAAAGRQDKPAAAAGAAAAPKCKVHKTPMRRGNDGGWFCPRKMPDDTYCTEKVAPPKPVAPVAPAANGAKAAPAPTPAAAPAVAPVADEVPASERPAPQAGPAVSAELLARCRDLAQQVMTSGVDPLFDVDRDTPDESWSMAQAAEWFNEWTQIVNQTPKGE